MGLRSGTLNSTVAYAAVIVMGLGCLLAVYLTSIKELAVEWKSYRQAADVQLQKEGRHFGESLESIYQNLRTISFLPSVRGLTRNSKAIDGDVWETIQQVYNNLASNINVSEVYILPITFNPSRLDPATGKREGPLVAFDELIVQGGRFQKADNPFLAAGLAAEGGATQPAAVGPPEIESHEYDQMRAQLDWFSARFKNRGDFKRLLAPFISGEELITCDNTVFATTGNDSDRKGVVFSVPFYSENGHLAGMVSAIVRTDALRSLLANADYRLVSPNGEFASQPAFASNETGEAWSPSLVAAEQSQQFINSFEFFDRDSRGQWTMQQKYDAAGFYRSAEYMAVKSFTLWSTVLITCLTGFALFALRLLRNKAGQMRYRATHDALTNLPNRVLLEQQMQRAIASAGRGSEAAVFYLDLDRFKLVNDTLGHHAGDEVLKEVATRLHKCVRGGDLVARIGGDEFVVLLRRIDNTANTMVLASRIIESLSEPMQVRGQEVVIGTSIGIAMLTDTKTSESELLRHADLALFRAKVDERGSYRFYEPAMDAVREERRILEADMRQALQRGEFVIQYQPIINVNSGVMTGCEALIRWNHPTRGMVPPNSFIPLAEETGMINAIGAWVLKRACKDAMLLPAKVRMAVNISSIQFRSPALPLHVVTALNNSGLEPGRLELEVTESLLLTQDETVITTLKQLRSLGVRIALDDFGTGYSSLGYLKNFEFDKIKIDRSFVNGIENDKEAAILKAITDMSASLGMTTVAEGVETASQMKKIREQGCTEVQGYYFSKPKPLSELLTQKSSFRARA
jgi:diguanylate cyclase (GGDEF)-like protein